VPAQRHSAHTARACRRAASFASYTAGEFRCFPPSPVRGDAVVTAGRRSANAAHFDQVKTEKPDSLEHAMQAGLIEFSPDHRDAAAIGDVQARERGGRPLIEPTPDTDLVTREHKVSSFPAVVVFARRKTYASATCGGVTCCRQFMAARPG